MWIFVLSVLALAHGSLADVDCSKEAYNECKKPALFSFVPTDISEYNSLCPQLPGYLRCFKEFDDQCGHRTFSTKEEYDGMYGAFSDLCEEGTLLNRAVTENLRCLNETFATTFCPEKVKAVTGPYRSPVPNSDDYSLPIEYMCLQDILESNCVAADIGKNCGKEALEATLEFLRRTSYIEDTCGKRNAEYLLKNLARFNLEPEQKAVVIATLEKVLISARK